MGLFSSRGRRWNTENRTTKRTKHTKSWFATKEPKDLKAQAKVPEQVLAEHLGLVQVFFGYVTAIEIPKRSLQPEPIKGVENPHDILLVFL